MTPLKSHLANELAWAIETTRNPPYMREHLARQHVEREYRRMHAFLRQLDNALRDWQPREDIRHHGDVVNIPIA